MILTVTMIVANAMIVLMDRTDHVGSIDDVQDPFHPSTTTTTALSLSQLDVGIGGVDVGHSVDRSVRRSVRVLSFVFLLTFPFFEMSGGGFIQVVANTMVAVVWLLFTRSKQYQ